MPQDEMLEPGAYGELGRLADELFASGRTSDDAILEAFLEWTLSRGIELWPHQEEACLSLACGNHLVLGTPTGSGKSMVALFAHFAALARDERSYYTAPIKALVSEKFFNLVELFGKDYVGMVTGDSQINPQAPVICCTAEILANQALREGVSADIGNVAMDEFHFYGDAQRGWAWQVPLLTLPHVQFLLMSATLGDMAQVVDTLERLTERAVDRIENAPRPVPLAYEYVDSVALEGTVELAVREGKTPVYIVHFSQDAAATSAQALASYGLTGKEERKAVREACKGTAFTTPFGKTLRRLLECGVGIHHAGMLPRYRLAVEKLAQQGLLPVICGTDTLGVGINVPIHTVLLTQLTKYDGRHMRRLRAREFHQIAGRAGRAGFDTEGLVLALAPEHEIENAKLMAKAGNDPKKQRKVHKKKPPEGFVNWSKATFEKLVEAPPETLKPRLEITHSMVLAEVVQSGDARARLLRLIEDSAQTSEEKTALRVRLDEVLQTLMDAGVVQRVEYGSGQTDYVTDVELQDNFSLDQPLSPFLLAALELLDPESETYALDVVSMAEATLEDPWQVLRAQEKRERAKAIQEMKMEGVEYEERMERLEEVTYPRPLEDVLEPAFAAYCAEVPWANDHVLRPKSVLRDMIETGSSFTGYIMLYGIPRSEGTLLRYLSDAYRVLDRTIPLSKCDEALEDIISWLKLVVRTTDSSLVNEWEAADTSAREAPPQPADAVVHDRRALTVLVRNALFARVRLAAARDAEALGHMDAEWGFSRMAWQQRLDAYYEEHEWVDLDADARSMAYLDIDEADEKSAHVWHVWQTFKDPDDDRDFGIRADVDLDATQQTGEVVFKAYRVGFVEELVDSQ